MIDESKIKKDDMLKFQKVIIASAIEYFAFIFLLLEIFGSIQALCVIHSCYRIHKTKYLVPLIKGIIVLYVLSILGKIGYNEK